MTRKGTYKGRFKYDEDKTVEYIAIVEADCTVSQGRQYMSNGDPGYPDEEEWDNLEVAGIDEWSVFAKDGEEMDSDDSDDSIYDMCIVDAERNARIDDCNWR